MLFDEAMRVARIRAELESWFHRYPLDHGADLRARFRSSDDGQHRGAFFELFLHEMLLRLSCVIEIHPEVPGTPRRPEFRVTAPDGVQFYLEARAVTEESRDAAAARRRESVMYDALNGLDSPDYWLNVEVEGEPPSAVPTRQLKRLLAAELALLNYEEVLRLYRESGFDHLPRWRFEFEGWGLTVFPIPKQGARGRDGVRALGAEMSAARWLSDYLDDDEIIEALFGSEAWYLPDEGEDLQFARRRNGVWTTPSGQYTRLSAVLIFKRLDAWNFPHAFVRLYHHHSPARPLAGPLTRLPQAVVRGDIEYLPGDSLAQLFDLPPDWPKATSERT